MVTVTTDQIDTDQLRTSLLCLREWITSRLRETPEREYAGVAPATTRLYEQYNLLLFPEAQIHELYRFICQSFRLVSQITEPCWMQCWLNVYARGDYIDWHEHWPEEFQSWHGYYGIDTDTSVTTYRVRDEQFDVPNRTGQLLISPSGHDEHRTWPWRQDHARITVAFDIVPAANASFQADFPWRASGPAAPADQLYMNHWMPVV